VSAFRANTAQSKVNVCFTPGGRSFASFDGTDPTAAFAGSVEFRVKRASGMTRLVALLPNGNARLAL
jgi:hypothetical protein